MTEDHTLATIVQAARRKKNLTQQRAARAAGVSRGQWAALEQGANVTVDFLRKIAPVLELAEIPIGGGLSMSCGSPVDSMKLLAIAELIEQHAEALRHLAMASILATDRQLDDTNAMAAFVADHETMDEEEGRRLERASREMSERRSQGKMPDVPSRSPARRKTSAAKRGTRR